MANNTQTKNKKLNTVTWVLVSLLILVLVAAAAIGFVAIKVGAQDGIYDGVTVSGIDVGGMSRREAEQKLESQMGTVSENKNFNVVIGDYTYNVTSEDFNMKYDATAAAARAYYYGREGTKLQNLKDILAAASKGYDISFTVTFNTDNITALSEKIAEEVNQKGGQSSYEVRDDCIVITLGGNKVEIAAEDIEKAIIDRFNGTTNGDVVLTADVVEDEGIDLEKIKKEIEIEPEDAYIDESDPENPVLVPEVLGRTIDIDEVKTILAGEGEGPKKNIYMIDYVEVEPEITRENLQFFTYNDLISTFTTYLNAGNKNRTDNIRLACSKIDGLILYPGDEFSFNGVVGERTYDAGFKDATIYLAGELADGVGGGICQVSSTIYNAAIGADLEITERHNHRYTVTYVKLGMDATVAYDSKTDFKFKNNSEYAIKISIVQESNYVKCEFYGTLTDETRNKTVSLESKTTASEAFGVSYKADETVPIGTCTKKNAGYTGYTVSTYRVTKIDGKEVSRTLESKSKYSKLDELYLINPAEAETVDGVVTYVPIKEEETDTEVDPAEEVPTDEEPDEEEPDEEEPDEGEEADEDNPDWLLQ